MYLREFLIVYGKTCWHNKAMRTRRSGAFRILLSSLTISSLLFTPLNVAHADGEPAIAIVTSNSQTTNIDKSVEISIGPQGNYNNQWKGIDYTISSCDLSISCQSTTKISIPYAGYRVDPNSKIINNTKIVRIDLNRFRLYFLKAGNFKIDVTENFVFVENPYGPLTLADQDCSKKRCLSVDASITLNVQTAQNPVSDINSVLPSEVTTSIPNFASPNPNFICPSKITSSQKTIECTYRFSMSVNHSDWVKYGITSDTEAKLSGATSVNFCSTNIEKIDGGYCATGTTNLENFSKNIVLDTDSQISFKNLFTKGTFCVAAANFPRSWCYKTPAPPAKVFSIASIEKSFRNGLRANCSSLPASFNSMKFQQRGSTVNMYGNYMPIYGFQLLRIVSFDNGSTWRFGPYQEADNSIMDLWNCNYPFNSKK